MIHASHFYLKKLIGLQRLAFSPFTFLNWTISGLFFFIFVFPIQLTENKCSTKILPMTGLELRTSGIASYPLPTEPHPLSFAIYLSLRTHLDHMLMYQGTWFHWIGLFAEYDFVKMLFFNVVNIWVGLHDANTNIAQILTINDKSVDGVLGTRTRGSRTNTLWRHPLSKVILQMMFSKKRVLLN